MAEIIRVQVKPASGEVIHLELSGAVILNDTSSREVSFTCSGNVTLKVVGQGNVISHVQAIPGEGTGNA
jgi:hypothetical protein